MTAATINSAVLKAASKAEVFECEPTAESLNDLIEALQTAIRRVDEFGSENHL